MFLLNVSCQNANELENILIYSTKFYEKSLYITTKNNTVFPYTITLYAKLLNGKVNKNKIKIKVYLTQHINVKFKLVINIQITEFFFVLSLKSKLQFKIIIIIIITINMCVFTHPCYSMGMEASLSGVIRWLIR